MIIQKNDNLPKANQHWYDDRGTLILTVWKDDRPKATTLTDARELGLFPSTTTIIKTVEAPGLNVWKVQQALEAYIADPSIGAAGATKAMEDIGRRAADMGTIVHDGIAKNLRGIPHDLYGLPADIVDGFMHWFSYSGLECIVSERTFVNKELGWAGTIDFQGTLNGEPIIADFKTQDAATINEFDYHEPEYPLQLASYDMGVDENRKRYSIKISRTHPGVVAAKLWAGRGGKDWEERNERWNRAFKALFRYWCAAKNYTPGMAGI